MQENDWVVFGELNEYRANRSGHVQSRVRKGSGINGQSGKRIVDDWKELTPYRTRTDKSGGYYYTINAGTNGKTLNRLHTLICALFHGTRPATGYEVDHIDGNRENNSAENLRWVTHKENMEFAKQRGAWKRLKEEALAFTSEFEFLSVMTQLNANVSNEEMQRRYKKEKTKFINLRNMKKQCGFVYNHRWLSKKVCKDDFFGGYENFPLDKPL